MNETAIMQRIRGVMNDRTSPCRLFRNNTGELEDKHGRWVKFGLAVGSADLIGIEKRLITQPMVGQTVGVFLSVEVKTSTGRLSDEQKAWMSMIKGFGGEAVVMRSVEEAHEFLKGRGL